MNQESVLVSGRVILDGLQSFSGATMYVRLEDVTQVGAPSVMITEQVIPEVSYTAGRQQEVEFILTANAPDPRARYNVRVHVDVDGNGRVSTGDYVSTESYPVLTEGHPDHITVPVSRVGGHR